MTKTHLFIRIIGSFFLIGIIVYSLLVNCLPLTIPPFASSLIIRDMHDTEIGEIIADERIRHREMGFDEIPTLYLSGLIWLEDRNFWDNNGVSLRGIARSIIHNLEA